MLAKPVVLEFVILMSITFIVMALGCLVYFKIVCKMAYKLTNMLGLTHGQYRRYKPNNQINERADQQTDLGDGKTKYQHKRTVRRDPGGQSGKEDAGSS